MEDSSSYTKILTDNVEVEPTLKFGTFSDTIVKMIKGSHPNFAVGIYGEWGTGKTTSMKLIQERLNAHRNILTIWFNAWTYEQEKQFVLESLMKVIAYKMNDFPNYKKAKDLHNKCYDT